MKKSNLRPSKGRPKLPADERKSILVPVKFDIDQYQVMMDKALMAGLNRSEYIRQSALLQSRGKAHAKRCQGNPRPSGNRRKSQPHG